MNTDSFFIRQITLTSCHIHSVYKLLTALLTQRSDDLNKTIISLLVLF